MARNWGKSGNNKLVESREGRETIQKEKKCLFWLVLDSPVNPDLCEHHRTELRSCSLQEESRGRIPSSQD